MKLLYLPMEILQAIAEESVIVLGPLKAQELRLVNKLLSRQILRAIFATKIIDSYPSRYFGRMSTTLKARHLETRTLTDPRGINEFTTVIQQTVDLLLRESEHQPDELRLKYTRILCAATADYLNFTRVPDILERLKTVSVSNDYAIEDAKHLFVAAAHVGNALLLENLLDKGVKINVQSRFFGRALRGAAFGGHRDALLLLLDRGADPNADPVPTHLTLRLAVLQSRHTTALQAAALKGHEYIVRRLLEPNYQVRASGNEYEGAILYAARGGHLSLVRFLLDNGTIMQPMQLQHWILLEASCCGHEPIVRMILDLGTNLNDHYRWDGSGDETPLRVAACHNFHKIVQLLLERGADPNKGGKVERWTPLYDAIHGGHERIAQTLLDYGADINAGLRTPLDAAVRRGNLHMVRFLLDRGAALDTEMQASEAILAVAAKGGYEPIVRLLVKFGASVDDSDREANRAMVNAMRAGHDHVVKTLLELGAKEIDPHFASGRCPVRKLA
ncbi:hypothetical protein MMC22_007299 [Lobaria immixta]|nr:hypothetical protein [Lobaria immixta]